jgi:hypothetical protein
MWISEPEWEAMKRRMSELESMTKVYGPNSSYQVAHVVQMILSHLKLHIHSEPPRTELRSKGGPEQP